MGGLVAPAEGSVSDAEVERLTALTDGLRAVLAGGEAGTAVVRGVRDSGERIARNALVDLELALREANGPERSLTVRLPAVGTSTAGTTPRPSTLCASTSPTRGGSRSCGRATPGRTVTGPTSGRRARPTPSASSRDGAL